MSSGFPRKLLEYFVHILGVEAGFQAGGRVERPDLSVHHHGDAVAVLGLIHVMGGDKNGDAFSGGLIDQFPELPAGGRINASGRFVKEDKAGAVEDGCGKGQPLLPSQRKFGNEGFPFFVEPDLTQHGFGPGGYFCFRNSVDPGEKPDVLPDGQIFIERESLAHVACYMVTITNLKEINQTMGHVVGDQMLKDFSGILESVGDAFGVVGRNGGNEFLMIVNHGSHDTMEYFIESLNQQLKEYNEEHSNAPIQIQYAYILNEEAHAEYFSTLLTETYNKLHP